MAMANENSIRPVILEETGTLESKSLLSQQLLDLAPRFSFICLRVTEVNADSVMPGILYHFIETEPFTYLLDKIRPQQIVLSRANATLVIRESILLQLSSSVLTGNSHYWWLAPSIEPAHGNREHRLPIEPPSRRGSPHLHRRSNRREHALSGTHQVSRCILQPDLLPPRAVGRLCISVV